jgi:hypothetical protein
MTDDPIIAEVRHARETLLARFGGDLRALGAELRRQQQASGRPAVRLPHRPARRPVAAKYMAAS